MEEKLSEVLDNLLGMLLLEGSYEVEEADEGFLVSIETRDAGRLIGARGESLEGLQLIINQIMSRKSEAGGFKRVMLDVAGWRKQREAEIESLARSLGKQVLESKSELELEPMSPWQRRVVHMKIGEMEGLASESIGEGRDRHVVIKLSPSASGEASSKTGEASSKTGEASSKTGEASSKTGEAGSPRGEAGSPRGEAGSPRGEASSKTGEASSKTGEAGSPRGEAGSPRGEASSKTGEAGKTEEQNVETGKS